MSVERTFALIKPDAVRDGNIGEIVSRIEKEGFNILRMEKRQLERSTVEEFYSVHSERPFFGEMVDFMIEGPIVALALEKEGAIAAWRDLMGATNPEEAAEGTLRKLYGAHIGSNAVHGSDAPETAATELKLFFDL